MVQAEHPEVVGERELAPDPVIPLTADLALVEVGLGRIDGHDRDRLGFGALGHLEVAVRELPPERILFATFAPELDPRVGMEAIRLMKLPAGQYAKVMGGNILELLQDKNS